MLGEFISRHSEPEPLSSSVMVRFLFGSHDDTNVDLGMRKIQNTMLGLYAPQNTVNAYFLEGFGSDEKVAQALESAMNSGRRNALEGYFETQFFLMSGRNPTKDELQLAIAAASQNQAWRYNELAVIDEARKTYPIHIYVEASPSDVVRELKLNEDEEKKFYSKTITELAKDRITRALKQYRQFLEKQSIDKKRDDSSTKKIEEIIYDSVSTSANLRLIVRRGTAHARGFKQIFDLKGIKNFAVEQEFDHEDRYFSNHVRLSWMLLEGHNPTHEELYLSLFSHMIDQVSLEWAKERGRKEPDINRAIRIVEGQLRRQDLGRILRNSSTPQDNFGTRIKAMLDVAQMSLNT